MRPAACHMRTDSDLPQAVAQWGWRFHHLGIPTRQAREGERYLPGLGMYVSGFPDSPFGVEWMRFEEGSPVADLVKTVPHLAFEVDDLEVALEGKEILAPPSAPSAGVRVAMIVDAGAPIELIEFRSRSEAAE